MKSIEESLIEVNEQNINKFTLDDIVMPLVGYKTKLPANLEL